ncbi:hypothetical protein [Paludisphaera rhizosphaerae]|uniref:hypothetical protein n=1 Tax=Paludisphaera rhizosphaerae TaxID=2711216 RepID=UPI0013ECBB5A|nr:hypothetical protein [Paludisphaera rhizosphaerae]
MHTDHDLKTLSVDDFAKQAELAGRTLYGFIRYDAAVPDVIYFGPLTNHTTCPQHPIPKGLIESLQINNPHQPLPCHGGGSGEPIGVMFEGNIVLKQDAPGGGLAKLVVSLANAMRSAGEQPSPEFTQQYCITINYKNGTQSNPYRYNSQADALNAKREYEGYSNVASVFGPFPC